jgi:hypothetical protein
LKIINVLSGLLLGSALCLSAGGMLLYSKNLVPPFLLELTAAAVAVIVPLSFFVYKKNLASINLSTLLGVIAPFTSISTPAHIAVLLSFGQNLLLSVLGLLQFLGFYLFPISFVIVRMVYRKKISYEAKAENQNLNDIVSQEKNVKETKRNVRWRLKSREL